MFRRVFFYIFATLSLLCLIGALVLAQGQVAQYRLLRQRYPSGSTIGSIPVGGLDAQAAGLRVVQAYTITPVEMHLDGSRIHMKPEQAGQRINLQQALASAESAQPAFWQGFWNFLWNKMPAAFNLPVECGADPTAIRAYLTDQVAPRYGQPSSPARPVPGDVLFTAGAPGSTVNIDAAVSRLQAALCSPGERSVELTTTPQAALPATVDGLGLMLETLAQVSEFDGLVEVYFQDLNTGQELNFALNQGHEIPAGIAFTGASTIKIPVMVSAYKRLDGELPGNLRQQMELMIDLSDNSSTDEVMQEVLDPNLAPMEVTRDMQSLGLENTFLAGFFYPGAPLLQRYQTPANQRSDHTTDPDVYNQTSAADMGRLLAGIQRCADGSGGILLETFSGAITQAECQEMTSLMEKNRKGVLLEAGLPEGTRMAHKYGWVTDANDGLLHTTSDAAVVYTPGGNFVLTVYLYHPEQLQWDAAQWLAARLATGAYNFYNQP